MRSSSCNRSWRRFSRLVIGCWLFVVGCWLLVICCWLLIVGCWVISSPSNNKQIWLLVIGCWLYIKQQTTNN
ncbi:MAG TPA: hypothetical protein DCP31_17725 [Cyanobacteria bacterium UBA8543]|nr:hypothetical protein [Cyanobacteria bacterium UBA8543]